MMRNVAADYIRVVSILYIVAFWHLQSYASPLPVLSQAYLTNYLTIVALALFVFSSGNFIGSKDKGLMDFYWKRFIVVYVPFFVVTFVYIPLDLGGGTPPLVKGLLLLGMLDKPAAATLWFANMICLFYLVAPLLKRLRDRTIAYLALCLAITAILCGLEKVTGQIDQRLILYFPVFAAGIFLKPADVKKRPILIVGLALIAYSFLTVRLEAVDLQYRYCLAPFALGSAMAITSLLYSVGEKWSPRAAVSLLASSSYFLYLLHRPVYQITLILLQPQGRWLVTATLFFIAFPATILLAWILSTGYAQLVRKYGDRPAFGAG